MTYVEGFVAAAPAANKDAFLKHAADAAALFKDFGVTRMIETWGDDVPEGEVTDFRRAVKAKPDETVIFSWFEYPDRAARDAANAKMTSDPRMMAMGADMPFDGKRMIMGGFAAIVDDASGAAAGYVDGALIPAPSGGKEAFRELAARHAAVFREHGATRVVDAWGDDVPDGDVTDFKGAVKASDDETVVYAWVEWPSKEVRDAGWRKVLADPRMHREADEAVFDPRRMIHAGFTPILDV